jgi:hypothetical protein
MFADGNHTFTDISKYLHKFDLLRKNGKPLHINEIRQILSSKFYIGIMFYNGEYHDGNQKCLPFSVFMTVKVQRMRCGHHRRATHNFLQNY